MKIMKPVRYIISACFVFLFSGCSLLLAGSSTTSIGESNPSQPPSNSSWPAITPSSSDFDYYLLALSWAPDYCSDNPNDTQECSLGRKYAVVLHGLWPQYKTGYPSDCSNEPMPASVKARYPHLYPNDKLFDHEWSKHGTCSGLSPVAYLSLARQFKDLVQVPDAYRAPVSPFRTTTGELKNAFLQVNPALMQESLAVYCSRSGRYLSQIYICISKEGQPAACGADVLKSALKSCANGDFLVRNVR